MGFRRVNFWIDPRRQSKFRLHLAFITLSACAVIGVSLYVVVWLNFHALSSLGLDAISNVRQTFLNASLILAGVYVLYITLLLWVIIGLGKRISHRLAGPLYSLKRRLDSLKEGDLTTPFTIRKSDFLHALSHEFERLRAHLQSQSDQQKHTFDQAKDMTSQIQDPLLKVAFSPLLEKQDYEKAA